MLVTPLGGLIPYLISLIEICSNNVAEYEALIIGLKLALEMPIDQLEVFGESQLIIQQMHGQYEVRNDKLVPLYQRVRSLMNQFLQVQVNHVPRSENDKADVSASWLLH